MAEGKICCKCGCKSHFGGWKYGYFFCDPCLHYTNIVRADCHNFNGTKRGDVNGRDN